MHESLTLQGWILMAFTWAAIIALNVFCFSRIFRDTTDEIPDPLPSLDKINHEHPVS